MNRLTWAALAAATVVAAIALTDAATHGLTGEYSVFAEGGPALAYQVSTAVHGILYALLVAVLVVEGPRIDNDRRAVRWVRRVLVFLLAMLAVPFLLDAAVRLDDLPAWLPALSTIGFVAGFPVSGVLGIQLLRSPGRRLPAVLLTAVLGGLALTLVLGALGSDFAHPAYAEVLQFFGVALLGVRAPVTRTHPATVASATAS